MIGTAAVGCMTPERLRKHDDRMTGQEYFQSPEHNSRRLSPFPETSGVGVRHPLLSLLLCVERGRLVTFS
jgi:hypothetical protein